MGNGMHDRAETDGERGSQRGRRVTRSFARDKNRSPESLQPSGGRESARDGRERTEPGGLSAVTGLGLRSLDELANPPSSDEMASEKERHRMEANV